MFHRKMLDRAILVVLLILMAWKGKIWDAYQFQSNMLQYKHSQYPAKDFFQDWAAARDHMDGLSIYEPLRASLVRHAGALGLPMKDESPALRINAHPPAMILCVLPLGRLEFRTAYLIWTWTGLILLPWSLFLTLRNLPQPVGTGAAVLVSLGLTLMLIPSCPVVAQCNLGNVQMVMLFLLCAAYASARRGRDILSGGFVGAATAIKLFPGFLAIYFLFTRRFRALAAMGVTFAMLQIASLSVFGRQAFIEYVNVAVPEVREWRGAHNNVSIYGIWSKLFDKGSYAGNVIEFTHRPELARYGSAASALIVLGLFLILVWNARSRADDGRLFGLSITTMLLLSPVTWVHSQTLLIPSIAVLACVYPGPSLAAWALRLAAIAIWIEASYFFHHRITHFFWDDLLYRPIANVTYASINCYAMLVLFVLGCLSLRQPADTSPVTFEHEFAESSASLLGADEFPWVTAPAKDRQPDQTPCD